MGNPDRRDLLRRIGVGAAVVLAVALLVSASAVVVDDDAGVAAPTPGSPIEWGSCGPKYGQLEVPWEALCGKLSVPVDYTKPEGPVADIAVIKLPATGPERIGSLVINPGGPGGSGIEAALGTRGRLTEEVRQRFDLVGFDPRGVGWSTPAVWCNSDQENDTERAEPPLEYTSEGIAELEERTRQFVQRCVDKSGEEFLANVGTVNVAKDLDRLRAALGDELLTYLGYSYGTSIGSAYAEQFPTHIRAMVLDGAIDPNEDQVEASVKQAASFQQAFDDFAADCALSADCPLGQDPAKATEVYLELLAPLATNLAPTADPRGLSYSDATGGTLISLYSKNLWQYLKQGLAELRTAGRGDTLLAMSDLLMRRGQDGRYDNSTDSRVAINCVDRPAQFDRAAEAEADRRRREAAPFMNYGPYTGQAPLSTCAFWPVQPTSEPHEITVDGLPPLLVISTTRDPATPYEAGIDLARQLDATLLTFDGTQHTVAFQGNACVDDVVTDYLVDLVLPPQDSQC